MNFVNGHAASTPQPIVIPKKRTRKQPAAKPALNERPKEEQVKHSPPAHVVTTGRVVTQVWAQMNDWGGVTWRVSQYRSTVPISDGSKFKSFHVDDLQDAMRGLYQAQQWIKRTERQRKRTWFGRW